MSQQPSEDTPMHISETEPVADAVLFDDMDMLPPGLAKKLIARGLVWCTEFEANGSTYCGAIIAASAAAAGEVAFGRGLGEKVIGQVQRIRPHDGKAAE